MSFTRRTQRKQRRSAEQLIADGRASSYVAEDGAMVLFGKRVRSIEANEGSPARIFWEDGTSLDFPDWETLEGVLLKFGWEFDGFKGAGGA